MDLIIRNGTVVTAGETFQADIGIEGARSSNLATGLVRPQKRSTPAASISSQAELMSTRMWTSNFSAISRSTIFIRAPSQRLVAE